MRNRSLTVCLDANVIVSAVGFGGKPLEVLAGLLDRRFGSVSSAAILAEAHRNLIGKLELRPATATNVVAQIETVSVMVQPAKVTAVTGHPPDDAVLAVAVEGRCDVLVTGDKRHLLPLGQYQGVAIEAPSAFLNRLESR